jgi:hypothetical protein
MEPRVGALGPGVVDDLPASEVVTGRSVMHVIPMAPPAMSGLADYARKLHEYRSSQFNRWYVLAKNVDARTATNWTGPDFHRFESNESSLRRSIDHCDSNLLVVHYVPHGYDPRGVPSWFVHALEKLKRERNLKVAVVFHELFVSSKPWRRSYLSVRPSKSLLRRVIDLSDVWVTSCEYYGSLLREFGADPDRGRVVPVGPNIEPPAFSWVDRWRTTGPNEKLKAIVFGLPPTRHQALQMHQSLVRLLAREGRLDSLTIAGAAGSTADRDLARTLLRGYSVPIHRQYDLLPGDLSQVMLQHDIGLTGNRYEIATKSGAFAACVAHGVIPIIPRAGKIPTGPMPFIENNDRHPNHAGALLGQADRLSEIKLELEAWAAHRLNWKSISGHIEELLSQTSEGAKR